MTRFLREVRKRVAEGWAPGSYPGSLLGAIYDVRGDFPIDDMYASIRLLNGTVRETCPDFNPARLTMCGIGLYHWSNREGRTRAEVLSLIDTALSAIAKEEA